MAGADIFGFDLNQKPIKTNSAQYCEMACSLNSACKAYTLNKRSSICYLKSGGQRVVGHPDAIAGYHPTIEARLHLSSITILERTDLPGNDYRVVRNVSFEGCIDACELDARCLAFAYARRSQRCWLKSAVPSRRDTNKIISGVKKR
jgi:hypothetical protein